MISEERAKAFCRDDISLIENYDKAIADDTQTWHCHHRRETIFSRKDLIEIGEYYNRPACELIFLTPFEHIQLHQLGKNLSEEIRNKMSEAHKGKHRSAETRKKISEAHKGKHSSAEARKKISECRIGKHYPKLSEVKKGLHLHWYNNGVKSILAKTCPKGFVKGRIKL